MNTQHHSPLTGQAAGKTAARAVLTHAQQPTREIQIASCPVVLGRHAGLADGHIDDQYVSRRHALLARADDAVHIEDLHSTNGTYLNGRPIMSAMARRGDLLTLGETSFWIEISKSESLAEPPKAELLMDLLRRWSAVLDCVPKGQHPVRCLSEITDVSIRSIEHVRLTRNLVAHGHDDEVDATQLKGALTHLARLEHSLARFDKMAA